MQHESSFPEPRVEAVLAEAQARFIAAPPGAAFGAPAWISDDELAAVVSTTAPPRQQGRVYLVSLSTSRIGPQLVLPSPAECHSLNARAVERLPDGRIGVLHDCSGHVSTMPNFHGQLWAYEPRTGETARLFPYDLPPLSGFPSFSPDMSKAIMTDGPNGLSSHFYWLYPDSSAQLDLGVATARGASWSPDGSRIAVIDMPRSLPEPGHLFPAFEIRLISTDGVPGRPIAPPIPDGGTPLQWSPNGQWLLGTLLGLDGVPTGLWIINPDSGRRALLLDGDGIGYAAWSPDGTKVAVTIKDRTSSSGLEKRTGLAIFDMPDPAAIDMP